MKKTRIPHIRRWLLMYLIVVLITVAAVSTISYYKVAGYLNQETFPAAIGRSTASAPDQSSSALSGIVKTLFWLFLGQMATIGGIGYLWYVIIAGKIENPARAILGAMNQLAKGQLDETVSIESPSEFRQIGNAINELAANLQELLLYVWKQTGRCMTLIAHIQKHSDTHDDTLQTAPNAQYLEQLCTSIEDLRDMAKSYVFYDVSLDDNKTHAINEPGISTQTDPPARD